MFLIITTAVSMAVVAVLNLASLLGAGSRKRSNRSNPSVASSLLERASAIEGQNPAEANELRQSALAFLSVAR